MLPLLKRIFRKDRRAVCEVVDHPVLGRLVYSVESGDWESQVGHRGIQFKFSIAADRRDGAEHILPAGALVSHAESIALEPGEFEARIRRFLTSEVRAQARLKGLQEEVSRLEIDVVCLMWPERPNDGMIQFRGPVDDRRLWRCDYVQREAKWLGFDT